MVRIVPRTLSAALLLLGLLPAAPAAARPSAAAGACPQVHFFGLRGSGESRQTMGPSVADTFNRFRNKLVGKKVTVGVPEPIEYSAVALLKKDGWPSVPGWLKLPGSMAEGAAMLRHQLEVQVRKCPEQEFVIAGYSQGAGAVRLALAKMTLKDPPAFRKNIKAILLYADPFYNPEDRFAVHAASTTQDSEVRGLLFRLVKLAQNGSVAIAPAIFPETLLLVGQTMPSWIPHARSYCHRGDIVCAATVEQTKALVTGSPVNGITIHEKAYLSTYPEAASTWLAGLFKAKLPDLVPARPVVQPKGAICAGSSPDIRVTVANKGGVDSGDFGIRWSADGRTVTVGQPNVAAGRKVTRKYTWGKITEGAHELVVNVDPKNAVAESAETNNATRISLTATSCAKKDFTVRVQAAKGWQDSGIDIKGKFNISDLGENTWSVDHVNHPYVGPNGYPPEQDRLIAPGYKYDSGKPYGYLLGKLVAPDGQEHYFPVGAGGLWQNPFKSPARLHLRINDADRALGDNGGSVLVDVNPWP
ncbi:cutinase family protein [Actinomadura sp. ATCC 31491]|uniref:Cutinase family protein n=1 Tax=Actinomadura luzonensis TaxID=2805427 RepID=A0ABT0G182_9ACTN|nr:cutinase family protein [Actinomadura luzonensis]MCK2218372.1 cutinase family protein [Actinomadura luzonensis]